MIGLDGQKTLGDISIFLAVVITIYPAPQILRLFHRNQVTGLLKGRTLLTDPAVRVVHIIEALISQRLYWVTSGR